MQGLFASQGAADAYGLPRQLVDHLVRRNDIVDLFPWQFDNQPVKPADLLVNLQGTAGDGSFVEGGCPDDIEFDTCRITFSAKSFGRAAEKLSFPALAAKQHLAPSPRQLVAPDGTIEFTDEWDFRMYLVLTAVREALEWLILRGDPTANANNFEGLVRMIRQPAGGRLDINGVGCVGANSEVDDIAGAHVSLEQLQDMIGRLVVDGARPQDVTIICRPGQATEITSMIARNYQDPGAKEQELMRQRTWPLYGVEVPYRTTQCLEVTGSGDSWTADMLFITTQYYGVPSLWLEFFDFSKIVRNTDLFSSPNYSGLTPSPFVMIPSDHNDWCTSYQFSIWAHGRLFSIAPQSLGKLENVGYSFGKVRTKTRP
jgi:hypothetical protein